MRIPRTHFIESERMPLIGPSRQTPHLSHRNDSDTALRDHPTDNPPPRWKKILDFVLCRQCAGESRTGGRPAVPDMPVTVPPDVLARQGQLRKAKDRLAALFSNADDPASRADSQQAIGIYLQNRFKTPVTEDVKSVLVLLDMAVKSTHQAILHGGGNVLVRDDDVLPASPHRADSNTGSQEPDPLSPFNLDATGKKHYLTSLGTELFGELLNEQPDLADQHLLSAAVSILTGSTACVGYASVFGLAMIHRYRQAEIADAKNLTMNFIGAPQLDGIRVNHVFCEAVYLAQDGTQHRIFIDPWATMNTPIMNEHSRYTGGEYQPPLRTDVPVNVEKLAQLMDSAAPRIERLMNSRGFQRQPRQILAQVGQADPAQRYSLTSPHNGFVDRHQLNMAKEDVILPPVRRPSLVSASSASLAPLMPPPARKRT